MVEFAIFVAVMIVISLIGKAKQQSTKKNSAPNPRLQKLVERIQTQQGFNQPVERRGKFTRPTGQGGPSTPGQPATFPVHADNAPSSQQVSAALQQLLQAGRQPRHPGEWSPPGQPAQTSFPVRQVGSPPSQHQPTTQHQPPSTWLPSYQPQGHRPPQSKLPTPRADTDTRVRELMSAGNEVAAIRLLCDEQDMGILDAQKYARALVAPPGTNPASAQYKPAAEPTLPPADEDTRYVGSAAFAESVFDLDREEDTWASGWVDTPEPEDRSDIDELWQTVRNTPRPSTPAS
jgi:hypothetical protein